ncbi:MAG: D-aminoacyl-tRNA deacylase, partial [Flavobacteriia bacterium]
MRVVIQRVSEAAVKIEGSIVGQIEEGLLVLLGIEHDDTQKDADYLLQKLINLRIFSDTDGKMNLSVQEVNGGILVVSQFT